VGSRGRTLSESEGTRAAEGVEGVEEDEVDEELEEEDAMAVGSLRGGDERGGRGREVWFCVWVLRNRSPTRLFI